MFKMMIELKINRKRKKQATHLGTVVLGGTFDHLHEGHHSLLRTAFKLGNQIIIGLTTDSMLKNKKYHENIQTYQERESFLKEFIDKNIIHPEKSYSIIPLYDPFGPTISEQNIDAIICSNESFQGCLKINQIRIKNNLNPLIIIIIPLTLNSNGVKLSSTDIRAAIEQELLKR